MQIANSFSSMRLNSLLLFAKSSQDETMSFDALMWALHGGPSTPLSKPTLTEFDVESFMECAVSNALLSVKEKNQMIVVPELRRLLEIFLEIKSWSTCYSKQSDEMLSLQFALTICVHLSKTVDPSAPATSQLSWLLKDVVQHYFCCGEGWISLPILSPEPDTYKVFHAMWVNSHLVENLATFLAPLNLSADWTKDNIERTLRVMRVVICEAHEDFVGFTWLEGIAINALQVPVKKAFLKPHLLATGCHEVGHYLQRKLVAKDDLNYSTPEKMAFRFINSDSRREVDAQSSSAFAEFGREIERGLFGGILNFRKLRPMMDAQVLDVCDYMIRTLLETPLAAASLPVSPILLPSHMKTLRDSGVMLKEEDANKLAKFGMLYCPKRNMYY